MEKTERTSAVAKHVRLGRDPSVWSRSWRVLTAALGAPIIGTAHGVGYAFTAATGRDGKHPATTRPRLRCALF